MSRPGNRGSRRPSSSVVIPALADCLVKPMIQQREPADGGHRGRDEQDERRPADRKSARCGASSCPLSGLCTALYLRSTS